MKKAQRMEQIIREMVADLPAGWPPEYTGFFSCFNAGQYYEAHDVLEHLWLRTSGAERDFFQALILLAGAFVHLRKQYLRPLHFKDGRRLPAAFRLFHLSRDKLAPYPALYWGLDLREVQQLIEETAAILEKGNFATNPWRPDRAPQLSLGQNYKAASWCEPQTGS
jgi:hypothetical protein